MPGLLSSIFDGASNDDQAASGSDGTASSYDAGDGSSTSDGSGDGSGAYQSDSSSYSAGADNDTHVDPSVSVGLGLSGSYETPDGSTHAWEDSQDVTLTTDTHVVTEAGAVLTMDDETFG